ncbi:haloacid dehalogenase [Paenibacillus sp. H1-7]|uniref:HAD hydrolase family protein n=1 Tax=Paenibacillus sp. H1-7 TaxID=2282849 RepID=UPI001EF7B188|nr:HAD hydrolase family protein [Paenibacillus sp. H1-7]ULL15633.1 haloacid dehalogenase [Paenibacillus sp. H1-7]
MNKHYLVTDLDGTLLQPDASLSPFAVDVVKEALGKGMVISYATARSYISSNSVAGAIPWKHPLLLYNGALLFDPLERRVLDGAFLDSDITNDLIRYAKSGYLLCPLLFALDDMDNEKVLHEPFIRSGERQFAASRPNDKRFHELMELACPGSYRTLLLTFIGTIDELQPLADCIQRDYGERVHLHLMPDAYIENHYFLEISHANANKRDGLLLWAKHVGCKPEDIVVFGDNLNDIGLFQAAGKKIAVANAQPQLKTLADEVIAANSDDGVARFIQALQ